MLFRQIIHEDLGCASYLVGDSGAGVAAVVDPQWDIEPYLRLSRLHGVRIEHVLETHNHADHVSGHGRLARATGAAIHVHRLAEAAYPHDPIADGWRLALGELELEAVHTPGHRPEHTAFLVRDRSRGEVPFAVLTGDSLFVGDVARPDLAIEPDEGASDLHRSLHERLLSLADDVEIWPAHLGGSLCGSAAIDNRGSSTIGFERATNPALAYSDAAEFVERIVADLGDRPPHTEHVVALNRGALVEDQAPPSALSPDAAQNRIAAGAIVVDARTTERFDEAHIPGALSASAYGTGFATRVARVVAPEDELIVVAESDGDELEAAGLLAAVGLSARGYLEGGMTAWRSEERPVTRIETADPDQLATLLADDAEVIVLDVRDRDEYERAHIPDSLHIPYGELSTRLDELPRGRTLAAICSGGKRSGLAASVLRREGFDRVVHITHGGVGTWARSGHPIE